MKNKFIKGLACALLFSLCISMTSFARAGGGGSSSGGSGGSSGSSSGGHSSYDSGSGSGRSNPVSSLFNIIFFMCAAGGTTIVFAYKVKKSAFKSKREMKENIIYGTNWDAKEIQERVEKAYFEIQECWRREDAFYAREYLSQECYEDFRMKLEWMKIRKESVVQKNVRLLGAEPVKVYDEEGEDSDYIWYLIHGKMIGYYVNRESGLVVRGNTRAESFYEYWRFVHRNGNWVLHEIKQKDEIDIDQFAN